MIEVEIKLALPADVLQKLEEKLADMDFTGVVNNFDVYYDTAKFEFLEQAAFVRIRNKHVLQVKYNENIEKVHGQVKEEKFPLLPNLEQAAEMNSLFKKFVSEWKPALNFEEAIVNNSLIELTRINNTRKSYFSEEIYISVDHVEDLGEFLEVEARYEEGSDTSHAIDLLQSFVANLNLGHRLERVKTGYVELWLRVHNPEAYKIGKYHL